MEQMTSQIGGNLFMKLFHNTLLEDSISCDSYVIQSSIELSPRLKAELREINVLR